jgi:hypothetical protein
MAHFTGTRPRGITLTSNEVKHLRDFPNTALYVVSEITLDRSDPEAPTATGGNVRVLYPWTIDEDKLRPTQYTYRLEP